MSAVFISVCAGVSVFYAELHRHCANLFSVAELVSSSAILSRHGAPMILAMAVACVLLGFDLRSREVRDGISDVVDSKPVSNLSIVAGRFLGLACAGTLTLATALVVVQIAGYVMGYQLITWSAILTFLLVDTLPTMVLWSAVLSLLASAIRHSPLTILIALSAIAFCVGSLAALPGYVASDMGVVTGYLEIRSEMLRVDLADVLYKKIPMVLIALGCLAMAAATYRRSDDRKTMLTISGAAIVLLGIATWGLFVSSAWKEGEQRDRWRSAMILNGPAADAVDVQHIHGRIRIEPSTGLKAEIDMQLSGFSAASQSLGFRLNPGMEVGAVRMAGSAVEYSHESGILRVELPQSVRDESNAVLSVDYHGVPNEAFGHLRSALDWRDARPDFALWSLGRAASIFGRQFVALMPASYWLPDPALAPNEREQADFFTTELHIEVPPSWRVAGPGRLTGAGPVYSFVSTSPVSQVGIVAAEYHSSSLVVGGVEVELLLMPEHGRQAEHLAELGRLLAEHLGEFLREAARLGIPYPHERLSFVEVPVHLRSYGGGWRMDATPSLPGVVAIRETTVEAVLRWAAASEVTTVEKMRTISSHLRNDIADPNLHSLLSRSLFGSEMDAVGNGAVALAMLFDNLVSRLLGGSGRPYSITEALNARRFDDIVDRARRSSLVLELASDTVNVLGARIAPATWRRAHGEALVDLDPWQDPWQALDVLGLKTGRMADYILDRIGRDRAAEVVKAVRRRFAGRSYTVADAVAVVSTVDPGIGEDIASWLHEPTLGGIVASDANVVRIREDTAGRPRYLTRLYVRNEETTPAFVRFQVGARVGSTVVMYDEGPVRIEGESSVEARLLSRLNPDDVFVETYLALNRGPIHVDVSSTMQRSRQDIDVQPGVVPSDWLGPSTAEIVVDDLDSGFFLFLESTGTGLFDQLQTGRLLSDGSRTQRRVSVSDDRDQPVELWRGGLSRDGWLPLPEWLSGLSGQLSGESADWSRVDMSSAWGKFRRTVVLGPLGGADHAAAFGTQLPCSDQWRLDFHKPELTVVAPQRLEGAEAVVADRAPISDQEIEYHLGVVTPEQRIETDFDVTLAPTGWVRVGAFKLAKGPVYVVATAKSSGRIVADAIRWVASCVQPNSRLGLGPDAEPARHIGDAS